ncbi:MAG: collagen triple helix repeat containing protein [Hyperionvirus sp.]|uniref:Collagen triple helix repeat containing protein n=1 Tax=Hyperionvirus sp. TaxID=2487770 RepID=A0A3G5A7X0_9VIRU|nr:MAG: collagen triple helix repeat containing protein [Hyperionvirus sp.]
MSKIGNRVTAEWVKQSIILDNPATSRIYISSLTSDPRGNVYAIGSFMGSAKIGDFPAIHSPNLVPFIIKLTQYGKIKYITTAEIIIAQNKVSTNQKSNQMKRSCTNIINSSIDPGSQGYSITVDDANNLFVTGSFLGILQFKGVPPVINKQPGTMMFVARFNANNGIPVWAIATYTDSDSEDTIALANAITADTHNSLYITGQFTGPINFESKSINTKNTLDMFLTKIRKTDGKFIWVNQSKEISDLDIEVVGNGLNLISHCHKLIYVVGSFLNLAEFGDKITLETEAGLIDAYVIAADIRTGEWLSATQTFSTTVDGIMGSAFGYGIVISNADEIFITGYFNGKTTFGGNETYQNLTGAIATTYISKIKRHSNKYIWLDTVIVNPIAVSVAPGVVIFNVSTGIIIDNSNKHIFVAGVFSGKYRCGDIEPINSTPNFASFIMRLNVEHKLKFVAVFQSVNLTDLSVVQFSLRQPIAINECDTNTVYLGGLTQGDMRIGQLLIESPPPPGPYNFWISSLEFCP